MTYLDYLAQRRSVYALQKKLPVPEAQIVRTVETCATLVPDAFNMRSSRAVIALGEAHDQLWERIDAALEGRIRKEKMEGFRAAAGTVLYFTDLATVREKQDANPLYRDNFPVWAQQANGMFQYAVWTGLRALGIGANLQHYNPIIDGDVRKLFGVPEDWMLVAQMPFGSIAEEPAPHTEPPLPDRVRVFK